MKKKTITVQKDIFHLNGGGPLDIPAVDKSKDGDAEDGEQFDNLEIEDLVNVFSYFKTYTIHQLLTKLELQDLDNEIFLFPEF